MEIQALFVLAETMAAEVSVTQSALPLTLK